MNMSTQPKNELNFSLILNRSERLQKLSEKQSSSWPKCHIDIPTDRRGILELFLDLQFLAKKEEELDPQCRLSPFFFLMAEISPIFRQTHMLLTKLQRPFVPTLKSSYRLLLEFDLFAGVVEYPMIKSDLHWLLKQSEPEAALEDFGRLLHYNFSVFHDSWHVLLVFLIPCLREDQFPLYFVFLETLVVIQEEFLIQELGPAITSSLMQSRTIFLAPIPKTIRHVGPDEFVGIFISYFEERLEKDSAGRWSPKNEVTKAWINSHQYPSFPKWLADFDTQGIKKFSISDFDIESLRSNPGLLKELWHWLRQLTHKTPDHQ